MTQALAIRAETPIVSASDDFMPMNIERAVERFNALTRFVQTIMKSGVDYGVVPGTDKQPTLLKPGAEKLTTFFGLSKRFEVVHRIEDWDGKEHGCEPLFYYVYRCRLYRHEVLVAEADGSANSRESKHRWRWVREADIPPHVSKGQLLSRSGSIVEPDFAIRKAETSGKYGKPAAYWARFTEAIANGTARKVNKTTAAGKPMEAWEIGETMYRVPNDDVASLINTIQKMSQKRALVAATLLAVNASEFFTQDVEDMEMIDVPGVSVPVDPAPHHAQRQQQDHPPDQDTGAPYQPREARQSVATAGPAASEDAHIAEQRQRVLNALRDYSKQDGGGEARRKAAIDTMKKITGADRVGDIPADKLQPLLDELLKPAPAASTTTAGPDVSDWEAFCAMVQEAAMDAGRNPTQTAAAIKLALAGVGMVNTPEKTSVPWRQVILKAMRAGEFDWDKGQVKGGQQ